MHTFRSPYWKVIFGLVLAAPAAASAADAPALPEVLTRASAVHTLTPEAARQALPVELRGVITCYDRRSALFFLSDASGGVYLFPFDKSMEVAPGTEVTVRGRSAAGLYSPYVNEAEIRVLGPLALPEARPIALDQFLSGSADSQWVELRGMVHSQQENWEHLLLELATGPSRVPVRVLDFPEPPPDLVGAEVVVHGVGSVRTDPSGRLAGFQLIVPQFDQIHVAALPPPDPFLAPLVRIADLMTAAMRPAFRRVSRIQGAVTIVWPDGSFQLADSSGNVRVMLRERTPVTVGEVVEAAGLAAWEEEPVMTVARIRSLGKTHFPEPAVITVSQAMDPKSQGALVKVEGRLIGLTRHSKDRLTLLLNHAGRFFQAHLDLTVNSFNTSLQDGSLLRLTGICLQQSGPHGAGGFSLWLRSPTDVAVLRTSTISERAVWMAATLFLGALTAAIAGWGVWVARKLEVQTRACRRIEDALHQNELRLSQSLETRERIARDLHDGIIQSIYAAGLRLEQVLSPAEGLPGGIQENLQKVRGELNHIIREVRQSISGLEPEPLKGKEFKTALKSLILTLGDSESSRFELRVDSVAAELLTPQEATHLLYVAREAVSNALRHAHAASTVISLQRRDGGLCFQVVDDGDGFDRASLDRKGRGLDNIATRARELKAALDIQSQPGAGTRISIDIPR